MVSAFISFGTFDSIGWVRGRAVYGVKTCEPILRGAVLGHVDEED